MIQEQSLLRLLESEFCQLRDFAAKQGWQIVGEHTDCESSAAARPVPMTPRVRDMLETRRQQAGEARHGSRIAHIERYQKGLVDNGEVLEWPNRAAC